MIEFLTNYGLWFILAGVFFAMHRFGMGCCGGGHRNGSARQPKDLSDELPEERKPSENE